MQGILNKIFKYHNFYSPEVWIYTFSLTLIIIEGVFLMVYFTTYFKAPLLNLH